MQVASSSRLVKATAQTCWRIASDYLAGRLWRSLPWLSNVSISAENMAATSIQLVGTFFYQLLLNPTPSFPFHVFIFVFLFGRKAKIRCS
jgi:hypothetical protein